jgi:hypothetical protein
MLLPVSEAQSVTLFLVLVYQLPNCFILSVTQSPNALACFVIQPPIALPVSITNPIICLAVLVRQSANILKVLAIHPTNVLATFVHQFEKETPASCTQPAIASVLSLAHLDIGCTRYLSIQLPNVKAQPNIS